MQARTLPTARGWAWIVDGFALWRRNPALITFLVFGMSLSLLLVAAVPFIGRVAMSLVAPALSLGVFNGCKAVAERRKVGPRSSAGTRRRDWRNAWWARAASGCAGAASTSCSNSRERDERTAFRRWVISG